MTPPMVSIVVPTYQRVGYVESAIRSVLDQEYPRLEVIVIDDGSTDGTAELLERIAAGQDPDRFRWERQENRGQSAAVNRGFRAARGDFLGYLSSDDYLRPGAIGKLVAVAEANPEADVVYPYTGIVDEHDRYNDTYLPPTHTFADALRMHICLPGVGSLVRRRLYERIGGWDEDNRNCPDLDWWLRAGDATFVRIPEVLGDWRSHPGSTSAAAGTLATAHEHLRVVERVFAREDLAPAMRGLEAEAAVAALLYCAARLDPGLAEARRDRRFYLVDRLGPELLREEGERLVDHLNALDAHARHYDARIASLMESVEHLRAALAAREGVRDELAAHVRQLQGELAAARAARPTWLRAARRLLPAALRHRAGVLAHRLLPGLRR